MCHGMELGCFLHVLIRQCNKPVLQLSNLRLQVFVLTQRTADGLHTTQQRLNQELKTVRTTNTSSLKPVAIKTGH